MVEPGSGPRHALPKRHRGRRVLTRLGIGFLVLALGVATAGFLYYRHLEGNIEVIDPDLGENRPAPGPKGPLNILLLGSDERVSGGGVLGAGGDLSDTTILLHLSADRSRAYAVSITRDLLVDRPECPGAEPGDPDVPAATDVQINTAFQVGGPNCTWRTVEALTKMRVDDTVVVQFDGFIRMVDALGGVPVCVPKEIDDPDRGIYIPEGSYDAKGDQALDYVRARYGIGDGTDIGRLKRQQAFLASMTNRAISAGTLLNPLKLIPFLEAVTESIEASPGLAKLSQLRGLANQLRDIGLSNVKFLSMPVSIPPEDINRRIPAPEAAALWDRIKRDVKLTPAQLAGAIDAGQDPNGRPGDTVSGTPTPTPTTETPTPGTPTATPTPTEDAEAAAREAVGLCA
ncbi:MAG TPA: LCP family protein [Nocardioidaceae bacterium]|nr:LCP family protein [Nocardioidaceae bacterium]